MKKITLFCFILIAAQLQAQQHLFRSSNNYVAPVVAPAGGVLLIPKGTYPPTTITGTFPFNPALGGGTVSFTGSMPYASSSTWGPQQLFDNIITDYDWAIYGSPSNPYCQLVFPSAVTVKKIFITPRQQGDIFPSSVTLKVDGVTIATYTTKNNISAANGLQITYSGIGYFEQPNLTGTTWRLEFAGNSAFIGELEFWGN